MIAFDIVLVLLFLSPLIFRDYIAGVDQKTTAMYK